MIRVCCPGCRCTFQRLSEGRRTGEDEEVDEEDEERQEEREGVAGHLAI
jgi:hypothetical protein